jgi:dimethylglycine catabolism A
MNTFAHLFSPLQVGSITLKNRIVSTAHAPALSEKDGTPGQRERDYFEAKARGGAGLVMFGGSSSVHERSPATEWSMIANRDDRIIAPYQALADVIHRHGAKTITQLTHMGPRAWSDTEDWLALWGPTQMPEPLHNEVPHAMSERDIHEVVSAFGAACLGRAICSALFFRRFRIIAPTAMAAAWTTACAFLSRSPKKFANRSGATLCSVCV